MSEEPSGRDPWWFSIASGPKAPRKFLFRLTIALWCALAPVANAAAAPSPTPAAGFSAERAATKRSRMYQAGLAYSRWVDGLAQQSGSEFLQRRVVDRVTWMSVLACLGSLLVLALLNGWLLWFVRRRAGAIESSEHQSWLALAASSARKPLALIIWVIGGFLAFMPVVAGISSRSERLFPITYFIEKPFQNWSRKSEQLLGTIFLYLDYEVPLCELREELKRLRKKTKTGIEKSANCRSPKPNRTRSKCAPC
jgi:hypothetical protein